MARFNPFTTSLTETDPKANARKPRKEAAPKPPKKIPHNAISKRVAGIQPVLFAALLHMEVAEATAIHAKFIEWCKTQTFNDWRKAWEFFKAEPLHVLPAVTGPGTEPAPITERSAIETPALVEGDTVTFTPTNPRSHKPVCGILQEVINNGSGGIGYHIFTPLTHDPTRVLRVWLEDGPIAKTQDPKIIQFPKPPQPTSAAKAAADFLNDL